jgi:two-component system CheB/CheR fusion protein
VASGHATHDLLAMVDQDMRARLRSAIQQANQEKVRVVVAGASMNHNGHPVSFDIDVQPVRSEDDELLLVCFVDKPKHEQMRGRATTQRGRSQVADLEQELKATKTELQAAIRSLEIAGEEQKAVNEEALSINEEYQSTNEELLTSKEELQSLNEELAALNSQLRESLDRQRTTSTICKTFCTARVLRRSSSIPTSISAFSRPQPSHCSASFPATSGDRLATLRRWPRTAPC